MGERGMSRGIEVGSLLMGVLALLCALASLAWLLVSHYREDERKEEVLQKLVDLEAKHDILQQEDEKKEEVLQRLVDLEAKHDLLQQESETITEKMGRQRLKPALCSLRLDPGPCRSHVFRWYYLPKISDCLQFPWGGCQGNDNNFMSLAQCRAACLVHLSPTRFPYLTPHLTQTVRSPLVTDMSDKSPHVDMFDQAECVKPPESGPCQERLIRFYYDQGECKRFEYGGCAGNLNNFFSLNECRRKCLSVEDVLVRGSGPEARHRAAPVVDTCNQEMAVGDCAESVERFHWDGEKGTCGTFMWSGCGGNSNNFITEAKCLNRCEKKGSKVLEQVWKERNPTSGVNGHVTDVM